ncbi:YchJ family metal-binding protein [Demequina sp.]|uniref:YchJ family protein n=1 Tax=Demequina sp. TaxID=2050685 RepID=UPI0025C12004|nr:YchJ family metal-binding protein [Demequina sp.]
MRSRYTAYVRRDAGYLLRTWHPSTRPADVTFDEAVWLGLEVLSTEAGRADDATGVVEFVAHFQGADGVVASLVETSRFVREDGSWLYVDGDIG